MNAVAFDTLKTARTLEGRGFSRDQAEALAEVVADGRSIDLSHLATRTDLAQEVGKIRADLAQEASKIRADLAQETSQIRADLAQETNQIRADMEAANHRIELKFAAVQGEIAGVRADLSAEIADVRSDLKVMEQRMIQMEHRMTIKLGGMLVVIIGAAVAALRYLPALH